MVMKNATSLGEVAIMNSLHHHHQYASTPHLFVYQAVTDDEEDYVPQHDETLSLPTKEPIYSSAYDVRKSNAKKEVEAIRQINEKYDTLGRVLMRQESHASDDPLAVTEDDVARIETFFRGYHTQVWVCRTMANLYKETGTGPSASWQLRFTGVPLLLLDSGNTKSRDKRQLQLIIAEKGTGFALWRDIVDNLTSYRVQEHHFHTLYLSSDHRQRLGLSFNDGNLALDFHGVLDRLTSDPANISLSGPGKKKEKKEKTPKYKAPKKADISLPCNFHHVTNVDTSDKSRFFSLQLFSRRAAEASQPSIIEKLPHPSELLDEKQMAVQV